MYDIEQIIKVDSESPKSKGSSDLTITSFKLNPKLLNQMDYLINSGRYISRSEIVREAIRRFICEEFETISMLQEVMKNETR